MTWSQRGRRWFSASGVVVLAVGLLSSACHGSDDAAGSTPGAGGSATLGGAGAPGSSGATAASVTDLDSILAAEARGYCARLFRCAEGNDDFVVARLLLKTPAACEALLAELNAKAFSTRDLRRQLDEGALQIVPAQARACLDELASCNGTDSFSRGSCRDMVEGRVALGSACQRSEDCAGDAFCELTSSECPGTCAARKGSGESCQSDNECSAGNGYTYCDRDASGSVCRTLPVSSKATLGQPCTRRLTGAQTLSLCVDSLWCGPVEGQPAMATLGTCQAPIPTGSPCSDTDDLCDGSLCDTSAGVCRSVTLLEHAGDSCNEEQFRWCNPRLGLHCSEQGSCEAAGDGTAGSVCFNRDFQPACNSGLYCQPAAADGAQAICQPLLPIGASCQLASSCDSGACAGSCQARPCLR